MQTYYPLARGASGIAKRLPAAQLLVKPAAAPRAPGFNVFSCSIATPRVTPTVRAYLDNSRFERQFGSVVGIAQQHHLTRYRLQHGSGYLPVGLLHVEFDPATQPQPRDFTV